jgi:predicted phosphodiesterase
MMMGDTDLPFHRMMRKYGVSYVISGHVHEYLRMEREGIVYLMAGSSGGHLRGHDPRKGFEQGWFFGHLLVKVEGTSVEAVVEEVGEPFGRGRRFVAH